MRKQIMLAVIGLAVIASIVLPAQAQNKKSPSQSEITVLKNELARLRSELDTCQQSKIEATNTRHSDAIASLRAIRSALGTGANLEEFKKYQIESRIKIDALPNTEENMILKYISDIYKDAVFFGNVSMTGIIGASDLSAARSKYGDEMGMKRFFSEMNPNYSARGQYHDFNCISAEAIWKTLVLIVEKKFLELK